MRFRASQEQQQKLDDTILTYFHACAGWLRTRVNIVQVRSTIFYNEYFELF